MSVGSSTPGSNNSHSDVPFVLPRGKVLTTPAVRRIAMENKVHQTIYPLKFSMLYHF